jgi:hypothetical protein
MAHEDVVSRATAALAESVGLIIGSDYDAATRAAELAETFSEFEAYLEKANDDGGGSEDDSVGRVDHHASTVADLLTEAGTFPHRTAALHYLLNKPGGQALLARLHKAAKTAEKEKPTIMDTQTELIGIMKNGGGPVSLCKGIVDRGQSPCDEHSLVAALTKFASEQHPSLRPDTAFAQLYQAEESVRRACGIAKAAGPMFDVTIVSPGE